MYDILAFALVAVMLLTAWSRFARPGERPMPGLPPAGEPALDPDGRWLDVAVEMHYEEALRTMFTNPFGDSVSETTTADLRPEPGPEAGVEAVAVYVRQQRVGVLHPVDAAGCRGGVRKRIGERGSCDVPASISGGWNYQGRGTGFFVVRIDVSGLR